MTPSVKNLSYCHKVILKSMFLSVVRINPPILKFWFQTYGDEIGLKESLTMYIRKKGLINSNSYLWSNLSSRSRRRPLGKVSRFFKTKQYLLIFFQNLSLTLTGVDKTNYTRIHFVINVNLFCIFSS